MFSFFIKLMCGSADDVIENDKVILVENQPTKGDEIDVLISDICEIVPPSIPTHLTDK